MKQKLIAATVLATTFTVFGATSAFAAAPTVDAKPVASAASAQPSYSETLLESLIAPEYIPGAIEITVYADPGASTATGSSGGDGSSTFGTHAFITIDNNTSSSISVGKLSGIAPGNSVSIGTWGNKTEHKGLWYNLESKFVSQGAYQYRVSLTTEITSGQLSTLNTMIANSDAWSITNNCSSFAEKAWNSVSSTKVSAGIIDTPKNLADSIKDISWYSSRRSTSWDYSVYFAQGTGTPKLSTTMN